jgi:hypothetical protein
MTTKNKSSEQEFKRLAYGGSGGIRKECNTINPITVLHDGIARSFPSVTETFNITLAKNKKYEC